MKAVTRKSFCGLWKKQGCGYVSNLLFESLRLERWGVEVEG